MEEATVRTGKHGPTAISVSGISLPTDLSNPTSVLQAAESNESGIASLASIRNTSGLEWDREVVSLKSSQSGCYAPGALPVPLASNDTCNLGFYCKSMGS